MKKEIVLYHGSENIIQKPIYGAGNKHNDYGLGFYCTENIDLAKEWAVSNSDKNGYANKYILDTTNLKVLDLSSPQYNILHWITILLENRVFTLKNDISKAGKEFLLENYSIPYKEYDVIKGYRADDSYFAFAETFLNNTISCQRLAQALKLGKLGEQIVLKSQKAFDQIKYISSEKADAAVYYPLRKQRNEMARLAFLNNKEGVFRKDAIYLIELIRGDIDNNDPRLQ